MNLKNLFLVFIALFCQSCVAPPKLQNRNRIIHNQPVSEDITLAPQKINNVIETNYILPGDANMAIQTIEKLFDESDEVIFFVRSLNLDQIIEKLIEKLTQNDKFKEELFVNYLNLVPFWRSFAILARQTEKEFSNFKIHILCYSKEFSQIHHKKIIFYKNKKISAIIDGRTNFTYNGFVRSIYSTSLKQYWDDMQEQIKIPQKNLKKFYQKKKKHK